MQENSTKICGNCPLRLYNDRGYNIKGIGGSMYGNMIVISNVDKLAYKAKDLSFSQQVEKLSELYVTSTGGLVLDYNYITPLIKCKENNDIEIDNNIVNRCRIHLIDEMVQLNVKRVLLLGSAVKRIMNCSIEKVIDKTVIQNGIIYNFNYSPSIEMFDASKFEVFKEWFIKWIYTCKNNDYSAYEIINYDKHD